jgi:hypothetical protein
VKLYVPFLWFLNGEKYWVAIKKMAAIAGIIEKK